MCELLLFCFFDVYHSYCWKKCHTSSCAPMYMCCGQHSCMCCGQHSYMCCGQHSCMCWGQHSCMCCGQHSCMCLRQHSCMCCTFSRAILNVTCSLRRSVMTMNNSRSGRLFQLICHIDKLSTVKLTVKNIIYVTQAIRNDLINNY